MNDRELIWERYKLISEVPASLEFMGDDPEITSKLEPKFKPVQKSKPSQKGIVSKSIRSDINAWSSEKTRELMKSTVQTGTAKGLDRRRQAQGKPPLLWRLVDANLEQEGNFDWNDIKTKRIIQKNDLENLVQNNPSIKKKFTDPNGITVIMTPSGLDERSGMMAFSSWIRSHKCGHAILENTKNYEINDNISRIIINYHKLFLDSLRMVNTIDNLKEEYPILNSIVQNKQVSYLIKDYTNSFNFLSKLFTFGSARNGELQVGDKNEELVAQLMQTGKITLNKMIDERTIQNYIQEEEEYELKQNRKNLLNIEEYIANQIDQAIENCIGEILYDVV